MTQIFNVSHPLKQEQRVRGTKPSCNCRGAKQEPFEGVIKKVITNQSGFWYYLDSGVTVKGEWIKQVV